MVDGPLMPHPGPRPVSFEFPFEEARSAARMIGEVIEDLHTLVRRHQEAVVCARVGFEGRTRQEFDVLFDQAMRVWELKIVALEGQLDELETDIVRAERRREERETTLAEWHWRHQAWVADQESADPDRQRR